MSRRSPRKRVAAAAISGGLPETTGTAAPHDGGRVVPVDALRGLALCLMIGYHLCFDLAWFGAISADFNNDPGWLAARALIVSMFLVLVGMSLVLADEARVSNARFWRRIALVAGCAALVTAISYVMFPATFIFFGILHFIVIASIIVRPWAAQPKVAIAAAVVILTLGEWARASIFDAPWLNWIGLMTHKPATEDYVPLIPWLGVVCIGVVLGNEFRARQFRGLSRVAAVSPRWMTWLGRHSLLVYMVHQPILLGLIRLLHR